MPCERPEHRRLPRAIGRGHRCSPGRRGYSAASAQASSCGVSSHWGRSVRRTVGSHPVPARSCSVSSAIAYFSAAAPAAGSTVAPPPSTMLRMSASAATSAVIASVFAFLTALAIVPIPSSSMPEACPQTWLPETRERATERWRPRASMAWAARRTGRIGRIGAVAAISRPESVRPSHEQAAVAGERGPRSSVPGWGDGDELPDGHPLSPWHSTNEFLSKRRQRKRGVKMSRRVDPTIGPDFRRLNRRLICFSSLR